MYRVHPGTSKGDERPDTYSRSVAPSDTADGAAKWWASNKDQIETPIADLIEGFAEVGKRQIPYWRVPVE